MNGIRLFYDFDKNQWILDTPVILHHVQLEKVILFTRDIYNKRINGEVGERKRKMKEALLKLNPKNIKQVLSGPGEKTLFTAGKY